MDDFLLKLLLEAVKCWGWPWGMLVLSIVLLFVAWWKWPVFKARINPPFDTPIRDAIHHVVSTVPLSFDRQSRAELEAFEKLYECMCSGKLPVKGTPAEGGKLQRIFRWKCKKLTPFETVIPRSLAAPEGVRFSLYSKESVEQLQNNPLPRELVPGTDFIEYSGLMVRSCDLYRLWPMVNSGDRR